jgi:hypothetical protein
MTASPSDAMMTPEEHQEALQYCIANIINSMLVWQPNMLLMFYERYAAKFCTNCGKKKTWIQDMLEPCPCTDDSF